MTKRKPGAQPNNKNAQKHGFYAKGFTPNENIRLEKTDRLSIESEIDLLRVYIGRIASLVDAQTKISEEDLKALNTLAIMSTSISTMIRTEYLTRGKGGQVEKGIMEALEEIRIEMGL